MIHSTAFITLISFALAVVLPACTPREHSPSPASAPAPSSLSAPLPHPRINADRLCRSLHTSINKQRLKHELPTLRWDGALTRIAVSHSKDMATRNYFSHTTPEGRGLAQRYLKNSYACGITVDGVLHSGGENIARIPLSAALDRTGSPEDDALFKNRIIETILLDWQGNPTYRSNVLSPYWQREGIGVSIGPDGTIFVTVNFC